MGLQATSPPTSPLHRPPPPMKTQMLKRKHDVIEDDDQDVLMAVTTGSGVKKICVEVVCHQDKARQEEHSRVLNNSDEDIEDFSESEESENEAQTSSDEALEDDSIMVTSSNDSSSHSDEENKENHSHVNKLDSILAKTLLNTTSGQSNANLNQMTSTGQDQTTNVQVVRNDNEQSNPKVIVEHKPLPSIYDLQQMSAACDNLDDNTHHSSSTCCGGSSQQLKENDSGVSDDEDEDEVSDIEGETEDETENEEDHPSPSPIFDPVLRGTQAKPSLLPSPPKAIYDQQNRGFWSTGQAGQQQYNNSQQQQQNPTNQNTFQFLEQTTQRIECAENGKSYLQLGTMNAHSHHHLPVTPVIQPKPNMVYRRPIPPFRNNPSLSSTHSTQAMPTPRPVCDHSNCFQKKNSFCYQSQRSRMLNLSLSKLHMARQSHDGSLRRSVLICNMLRYIEDETDREAMSVEANAQANQYNTQQPPHSGVSPMDQTEPLQGPPPQVPPQPQYWSTPTTTMNSPPPATSTISTNMESQSHPIYNMAPAPGQNPQVPNPVQPQTFNNEAYETTLKDFNSAFRSTPYSSPAHPGSDMDSGLGDDDRGINWSSVLSLSSQSELDPLNNNTFATEAWPNTANTPTTLSSVQTASPQLTDISSSTVTSLTRPASSFTMSETSTIVTSTSTNVTNATNFDDIGWKLSADDVLKAFPNDENLFSVGAGP